MPEIAGDSGWKYRPERDYDEIFSKPPKEAVRKEIADIVGEAGSVLDCGGGTGLLSEQLTCDEYARLDFCEEFNPDILADLRDISLDDNSYEVCVTKNCLQHIRDWKKALSEIMRVARERAVLAERTIFEPTKIVKREPVFRRQFNRDEFRGECEKYGRVSFKLSDADSRVGIYEVFLR